jgi:hypothetical protein
LFLTHSNIWFTVALFTALGFPLCERVKEEQSNDIQITVKKFKHEKNQGNVTLQKSPQQLETESKDNELAEMFEREFRSLMLKMISDLKEDSNKQKNKVNKSI